MRGCQCQHAARAGLESLAGRLGLSVEAAATGVLEISAWNQANALRQGYEVGHPGVRLTQVMVAAEKSSIAFEAMTQVRNKLVDAYKEIMNMPV